MNESARDRATARSVGWAGWSPVLWLFIVELVFGLVLVPLVFFVSPLTLSLPFLLTFVAVYALYFWIAFYGLVEFELWRRMRNLGHMYQFLGSVLIVVPVLWNYLPSLLGLQTLSYGPVIVIVQAATSASGGTGLVMALYGYYHEPFHARDVDLYRNVVVRAGERLDVLTDGYSTRIFETRYEGLPSEALRAGAEAYARRFEQGGFFLAHHADDEAITLYPVAYAGLGTFRWGAALRHLYRLARQPGRLTWIRVEWSETVRVHISPDDYRRIRRPVAHHLLCTAVADAVVGSLLAFTRGDEPGAVATLLGPDRIRSPRQLRLPGRVEARDARILVAFAAILLVTGVAGTAFSVIGVQNPYSISNVRWSPDRPVPGQTFQVYATLTSLEAPTLGDVFELIWWSYFGTASAAWPPSSGVVSLQPYQGNEYAATLGPFANDTEVAFVAAIEVQGTLTTKLIQSPAYAVDIGTVIHGGPSGLSLSSPQLVRTSIDSGVTLGVWINSTAPLVVAQVLVAGTFAYSFLNGGGSYGLGSLVYNLTPSGGYYSMDFPPGTLIPVGYTHLTGTLDYMFVAQDATGNAVTSGLAIINFDQTA